MSSWQQTILPHWCCTLLGQRQTLWECVTFEKQQTITCNALVIWNYALSHPLGIAGTLNFFFTKTESQTVGIWPRTAVSYPTLLKSQQQNTPHSPWHYRDNTRIKVWHIFPAIPSPLPWVSRGCVVTNERCINSIIMIPPAVVRHVSPQNRFFFLMSLFYGLISVQRQKAKLSTRSGWWSKYRWSGLING